MRPGINLDIKIPPVIEKLAAHADAVLGGAMQSAAISGAWVGAVTATVAILLLLALASWSRRR